MNREIKFRGKSYLNNEWVFGDLEHHRKYDAVYMNTYDEYGKYSGKIEVFKNTVGQFTGLYDKNGTPIYEGDIVRYWHEDTRCINPDCDAFNWIYDSFIKKVEGVVSYEDGIFVCEDYTPLCWCGIQNLEELRNELNVTEEDGWMDCDGNVIDESVLGIEVIGNIHDEKNGTS